MKTETAKSPLPPKTADRYAFLREHPIFGVLGPELLQQLRSHALQKTIPRGTTIFSKGDPGTSLFAILEGQVKVVSFSAQGKNAVFNVLGAGDIFGEIALLDGGERTADVTAVTDCKLMVIERRDFLPLVHSRPDVSQKLIEVLCARLRHTSRQVEEVMFLELPAKLAKVLLRLGAAGEGGKRKVALTQSEIAQIVGASRESTNKQLREWEERNWIRLERGGLVLLAPQQLEELADGDE
jgi:CRP-like cAMP-binding protein